MSKPPKIDPEAVALSTILNNPNPNDIGNILKPYYESRGIEAARKEIFSAVLGSFKTIEEKAQILDKIDSFNKAFAPNIKLTTFRDYTKQEIASLASEAFHKSMDSNEITNKNIRTEYRKAVSNLTTPEQTQLSDLRKMVAVFEDVTREVDEKIKVNDKEIHRKGLVTFNQVSSLKIEEKYDDIARNTKISIEKYLPDIEKNGFLTDKEKKNLKEEFIKTNFTVEAYKHIESDKEKVTNFTASKVDKFYNEFGKKLQVMPDSHMKNKVGIFNNLYPEGSSKYATQLLGEYCEKALTSMDPNERQKYHIPTGVRSALGPLCATEKERAELNKYAGKLVREVQDEIGKKLTFKEKFQRFKDNIKGIFGKDKHLTVLLSKHPEIKEKLKESIEKNKPASWKIKASKSKEKENKSFTR